MKKLLKIVGSLLLLILSGLSATWIWFNEENLALDEKIRATFNEAFVELPEGIVHYELGGPQDGDPIVLVHGFSVPSYIWDPTFEMLTRAGFRVLRFDLYGRGHSDRPEAAYTLQFFADQLGALTHELAFDQPFILMGLSMGGPVTTRFTIQHPDKVKKLVLVDPMVFAPAEEDIAPLKLPLIGDFLANVYLLPAIASGQTSDFHQRERFPGWEAKFREQMRYRGFRRAILSTIREFDGPDILASYRELGESGRPVHVFWGRLDKTVPLEHSEKLLELVPQAGLTVIDQAGHLPHYEQPDVFAPLLLEQLP
jgi:pimeloyl-ACP methyl ester carboxylesterase